MTPKTRRLAALVPAVAALGAAAAPAAAATHVTLSEVLYPSPLTSERIAGAPHMHPVIRFEAALDNGAGGAPDAVGQLAFTIDRRQIAPGALTRLAQLPSGTRVGFIRLTAGGHEWTLLPMLLSGKQLTAGAPPTVSGSIVAPAELASALPGGIPFSLSSGKGGSLVVTVNLRDARGPAASAGVDLNPTRMRLTLFGVYRAKDGSLQPVTYNRSTRTELLHNTLTVSPCADGSCTAFGPATTASVSLHLPKVTGLIAPHTATYGAVKTGFSGIRYPGDAVELWEQHGLDDFVQVPGAFSHAAQPTHFMTRATLRTVFDAKGVMAHPATGRYAVASIEGGSAIVAEADNLTTVHLAKPRVSADAAGSRLHLRVRVPGGDRHVIVRVTLHGATVVRTHLKGQSVTRNLPFRAGAYRVTATVPGARSSHATVNVSR